MLVVAVLGGGHGALAAAGDLALRGFSVRLALRNRERFAELFATGRVALGGAIEGTAFGPRMIEVACTGGWADGRIGVGCEVWTVVDRDREHARDLGRRVLGRFLPSMGAMTAFYGVDPHERPIPDRTLDLFVAAGTPADVARGVERLVAAGPATVTFSGRLGADPLWAIEALGDIVSAGW